ncbi:MAG TPA: serine hydrolase domain-containing protein, partial [Dehalococcoidia bacterium]|nr:serine hydrolase domain-containing protein [Dehalococcoidia bacterium]
MTMGVLGERRTEIQARLDEVAAKHGIPGMAVGLLSGEETLEAATGVVNIDTGVEATPDAVFNIGSVTKMYTATLVMQLVARGLVDLSAPITTYLPELRMEETADISDITVLHLLTHTSGIEGDCFFDTGRGDD